MNKSSKIVRTKTTLGSLKKPENLQYEINLMTFSEYVSKSNPDVILLEYKFELYPYKWYQFSYLVDFTYYYLFKSSKTPSKNFLKLNKTKSIIIRFCLFIIKSTILLVLKTLIL
jgi:hypothetical protein